MNKNVFEANTIYYRVFHLLLILLLYSIYHGTYNFHQYHHEVLDIFYNSRSCNYYKYTSIYYLLKILPFQLHTSIHMLLILTYIHLLATFYFHLHFFITLPLLISNILQTPPLTPIFLFKPTKLILLHPNNFFKTFDFPYLHAPVHKSNFLSILKIKGLQDRYYAMLILSSSFSKFPHP